MPHPLLEPSEFLKRLTECFESSTKAGVKGTVWLTHKRYTYQSPEEDEEMAEANEDRNTAGPSTREYDVLIRCTDGKDINFSTRIPPSLLPSFHASYGSLLKASMSSHMRKRDKKKEKAKVELKLKKRRDLFEKNEEAGKVVVGEDGKKRNLGHRQRQRRVAALKKREAERARIEELERKQQRSKIVSG